MSTWFYLSLVAVVMAVFALPMVIFVDLHWVYLSCASIVLAVISGAGSIRESRAIDRRMHQNLMAQLEKWRQV